MLDARRGYDLIGDVHGCALTLARLLERLGYRQEGGVWRHPRRMALFVGDILDRGPRIRQALELVRRMVEAGSALCLMGNHEFNALAWTTPAPPGSGRDYVRDHTARHERMIHETLEQFAEHPQEWRDTLEWFYSLPLLLDAGRFRVVHACWDHERVAALLARYPDARIDAAFVIEAGQPGSEAHRISERLLRGLDLRLPHGLTLTGHDGVTRSFFRTRFWADDRHPQTYGDVVFQPDALPEQIAQHPLTDEQRARLLLYGHDEPLLFVGHYWRSGTPAPLRPNLACLDYSAVKYGKLVAYRLDDENQLDPRKFVWVDVPRPGPAP